MKYKTYESLLDFLASLGWCLECYSPLEISCDASESRATGEAAQIVIEFLEANAASYKEEDDEE